LAQATKAKHILLRSTTGPLSIDMSVFSRASKMAKIEKIKKLKNHDLMKNPYII
jgi:hypothetical protein